jgi:hypothetical protein
MRAWLGACAGISVLLATGWGAERTAGVTLRKLAETVDGLEGQRTEAQRRLLVANGQRARLVEQLQTVVGARRPQLWPRRLVTLAQQAPSGVFLTSLQVDASAADTSQASENPRPPATTQPAAQAPRAGLAPEAQMVRLIGYALDHAALLQFLHALQSSPDWQHVELIRAAQEAYQGALLVAFEMSCRTQEARL